MRYVTLVLASALGCGAQGAGFDSVARLPDAGGHAPGVSVDPAGDLPASSTRGSTDASVLVLRSPTDPGAARATVRAFFKALLDESVTELDALLAPQAVIVVRSRPQPAREHYLSRFGRLDYTVLRGETLYREADLEFSEPRSEPSRKRTASGAEERLIQRVVRVRMTVSWTGRARLFGDELVLRLVERGRGFTVSEIAEDF